MMKDKSENVKRNNCYNLIKQNYKKKSIAKYLIRK